MREFAQIFVPVDYSQTSQDALCVAADMARAFNGRLLVMHFVAPEMETADGFSLAPDGDELTAETERLCNHVRTVLGADAPAYEVAVKHGSPYLEIVEHAVDRHVDLIVIGARGETALKHALLGSVADKVVRLAPCPVLTVRGDVRRREPLQPPRIAPPRAAADTGTTARL
jgi:nucleotide-binding universal stress UspA family protein